MSKPQDGGPAFPVPLQSFGNGITISCEHDGMSLRDWFAGQALAALLAGGDPRNNMFLDSGQGRTLDEWLACTAYDYADAMLAARKEGA